MASSIAELTRTAQRDTSLASAYFVHIRLDKLDEAIHISESNESHDSRAIL